MFDRDAFDKDAFYIDQAFKDRKIIVYGAGGGFHWFYEIVMQMHGVRPVAILDRNLRAGQMVAGIPAFSPEEYCPTAGERAHALVVVCVGNSALHAEITATLAELGLRNSLFLLDVYEVHNPFNLPADLGRRGFNYFKEQKEAILAGLELFTDEVSREIYVRSMQTHMLRKPTALPMQPENEQYFPSNVPLSKGYGRFVNCGAYDGDTIRRLNAFQGKVEDIVCFEPEPKIFARLVAYLAGEKASLAERVVALPCAVYSREATLPFISSSGLGSRLAPEGDTVVQAAAIDHLLPGFNPTFICMDVEGAEPEALKGAEITLHRSRPDLAVCVYHAPNHLWEIPRYIHDLQLGYRLYLRNYTSFSGETVLYATMP